MPLARRFLRPARALAARVPAALALAALVLAALLPRGAAAQAGDVCTVVHVRGTAWTDAPETPLASGARLAPSDTLRFAAPSARVLALCPQRGRVVFRPTPGADLLATPRRADTWWATVQTALAEGTEVRALSTRDAPHPDTLRSLRDVRRHFGPTRRYLVLGAYAVPVAGPLADTLAAGARLTLASLDGARTHRLRVTDGALRVDADTLARLAAPADTLAAPAATPDDAPVALLRWTPAPDAGPEAPGSRLRRARVLTAVRPSTPPPARVQTEVRTLARVLRAEGAAPADVRAEARAFLADAYGTPFRPHVDAWLDRVLAAE